MNIDYWMQLGITDKGNMPNAADRKAAITAAGPASSMGTPISIDVKDGSNSTVTRTMQPDQWVSYLAGFGF